jgi:hypothetical protein
MLMSWNGRVLGGLVSSALLAMASGSAASGFIAGPKLIGSGNSGQTETGYSVALSADGSTALVAGPDDNSGAGAVWVFVRANGRWSQQGPKLVGAGATGAISHQGTHVALSADGNTALVGARDDNSSVGAAWVFTRSGTTWTQQGGKLTGSGTVGAARFGTGVALSSDGNTAAMGGYSDNSSAGAIWIFTRSGGVWTQQGSKLVADAGSTIVGAGVALSSDGNTLLASGSPGAFVFTRSGGTWSQQGSVLEPPGVSGVASVALSADGNAALLGVPGYENGNGAGFIFTRTSGTWMQTDAFAGTGATGSASVNQGTAVALSADGRAALLGGPSDDSPGGTNVGPGAVWSFRRTTGTFSQDGPKLIGMGGYGDSWLGESVAMSADGNTMIAGGPLDHTYLGGAWIFMRSCTADANADGNADVGDVFFLINFLFASGPAPQCP